MTGLTSGAAALLLLGMTFAPAVAQMSEPAAFDSQNPDRSSINGGALTPWGEAQHAAQDRGGAANAFDAVAPMMLSACAHYRSFDPAAGTFRTRDGRRHACR